MADTIVTIASANGTDADVTAAASGDRRAFERLYRAHVDRVFAICARMLADRQLADEATQDVFVRERRKTHYPKPITQNPKPTAQSPKNPQPVQPLSQTRRI